MNAKRLSPAPTTTYWRPSNIYVSGALLGSAVRPVSHKISRAVAAEQQSARRAQQALSAYQRRMLPYDLAGLIIDGPQVVPQVSDAALGCAPALRTRIQIGQVKQGVRLGRAHVEQTRVRIEAGRGPVRGAVRSRGNQRSRDLGVLLRIPYWLALLVDPFVPVQ